MFGRRATGMSAADVKVMGDIAISVMELTSQASALKAENKALREDRDTWKALALKLSGAMQPQPSSGNHAEK